MGGGGSGHFVQPSKVGRGCDRMDPNFLSVIVEREALERRLGTEIEQKPDLDCGRTEIVEHLSLVSGREGGHSLELDYHNALHKQVGAKVTDALAAERD